MAIFVLYENYFNRQSKKLGVFSTEFPLDADQKYRLPQLKHFYPSKTINNLLV